MKKCRIIFVLCLLSLWGNAQNYTAINGSSYIGSLNVHNNPSAIVNSPLKWDITLVGLQDKHTTNAVKIHNYSLLSNPVKSEYAISNGRYSRYADMNVNLNLLNTRIALNRRSAIAFGANLKSYLSLKTSPYNFVDTMSRFGDIFSQNEGVQNIDINAASSSWVELYASYGQVIFDNEIGRLNGGITLKLNRGLSGAFVKLANGNFSKINTNPAAYRITDAALDFAYSSNYDRWDSARKFKENASDFFSFTEGGGSLDIGFEYLVKLQSVSTVFDDDTYFDYDWKIGVSLLDMGYGQYRFGQYSTRARNIKPDITDTRLDQTFDSTINSVETFRDSLATVFNTAGRHSGKFLINHPGRLVVNVDKFITAAFFLNVDLSVGLSSLSTGDNKVVKDMNLLTLTPRWETRKKGFYLPVYYNYRYQLWIGGAIRLGPVLLGVHNWSNLFSKKKMQRGGGYLAIILKASDYSSKKADKRLDCYW